MSVSELPDEAVPLEHQIAGHKHESGRLYTGMKINNLFFYFHLHILPIGMLKHVDGYVMKPVQNNQRGITEIEFYKQILQTGHPTLAKLKCLIPRFFGLHQFVSDTASKII